MKKTTLVIMTLVLSTLLFSGCRTNPVRNVNDNPTNVSSKASLAQVRDGIVRAGTALGWAMNADAPGHVLGTLNLRKHVAVVDINYDREKYSITYKNSTNLKYDGTNIHSNYNGWIENLDNAIRTQLSTL